MGFASWQRHCTASSRRRQPNFAALNRGRHLCSAGRPSRWALAHISSPCFYFTASHPWSVNIMSSLWESTKHPNNIAKAVKAEGTFSSVHMWAQFVFIVHNVTVKFCWCSCCRQCYQMKHLRLTHKEPVPKMCRKIVFHTYCQVCSCICMFVIMAALWNRAGHYIFALWFRSLF